MEVILTDANLAKANVIPPLPRRIHHESTAAEQLSRPADEKSDDILSRVLKMVPGEVAAGYTALLAVVSAASGDDTTKYAAPSAIVLCSILIVMLIRRAGQTHEPPVTPPPTQYVVSVAAFFAWAFSIRNPLDGFDRELPTWICGFAIILIPIFGGLVLQDRPPKTEEGA